MRFLSDATLAHLREIAEQPDFSSTHYRLVREIGRGGMGVVYEAEDTELQRSVAVKVLATEIAGPEATARLHAEAQTIARLEHPGIVPVHDLGTLPDGRSWYAMKLVRGQDLEHFLTTPRSRTELLRLFLRICEPVAFAHARGIVHRDLKPENVMIGSFGEVLVMDWGVAKALQDLAEDAMIVGTRGFMAPEQETGGRAVDARADVFALGSILRYLTRGGGAVPKPLRAVIEKSTASDRARRYADAGALRDDVARYLDGEAVAAHPENPLERAGRWLQRYKVIVAMVLAYLLMRVLVFFFGRT